MNEVNTLALKGGPVQFAPSPPAGGASMQLLRDLLQSASRRSTLLRPPKSVRADAPLGERLFEALASFKIKTAAVAMHFSREERARLFCQLDSLLSSESWDPDDCPPTLESFATLLRMLLFLGGRRPGLGATDTGNFIASWTEGSDRLTIECKPYDQIRYVLSQSVEGNKESVAGDTTTPRLLEVLRPYNGPRRWFPHGAD